LAVMMATTWIMDCCSPGLCTVHPTPERGVRQASARAYILFSGNCDA
jgi:hypothetical protein